ncbi:MAG: ribosomal protein [Patescibacteria group bacterium]|nr:ribosomal protein [Patescibacteria group bacterium]
MAPGGRHVEILGSYDPHSKQAVLKEDRIKYWLEKGAQASDTVYNLLVSKGIVSAKKRAVKVPAKKVEETPVEASKTETPKVEVPKEEVKTEDVKKEEIKPEEAKVEDVKKEEVPAEEKKDKVQEEAKK